MGTDIEKLVDLMIQERMQSQFAKWRRQKPARRKKLTTFAGNRVSKSDQRII